MAYSPRVKSPRGSRYGSKKSRREKNKGSERRRRIAGNSAGEEKKEVRANEVSEGTLRRLHVLGNQRFGSSPFSEHFERWLTNLVGVVAEFECCPAINIDEQFMAERSQILACIKLQLEKKRRKEATIEVELKTLSDSKNRLEQLKKQYVDGAKTLRAQKNREMRRLYGQIDRLRREQDEVVRMKTGFFRGISKRNREQKEAEVDLKLSDRQRELELVMLDFTAAKGKLREDFEERRAPVVEQIKVVQKRIDAMDTDGSLEDRWFACEALVDAVNALLQRKAVYKH